MGNPYMKLLSLVDPDQASVDFANIRGGTPKTNITYQGLNGAAAMPSFNISADVNQTLERISRYLPAMLAVVALNALILIIMAIVGLFVWCRRRSPKNKRRVNGRLSPMPMNPRHSYVAGSGIPPPDASHVYEPVLTTGDDAPPRNHQGGISASRDVFAPSNLRDSYMTGASGLPSPMQPNLMPPDATAIPQDIPFSTARLNRGRHNYMSDLPSPTRPHVYEPVSMALTDDTFVPPSPPFLNAEGSKVIPGDRPKSIA